MGYRAANSMDDASRSQMRRVSNIDRPLTPPKVVVMLIDRMPVRLLVSDSSMFGPSQPTNV